MVDVFKQSDVLFSYKGQRYPFELSKLMDNPYSTAPRPMFGASILTGEADYSNMRPDEVVPLVIQNDWRKGFQDVDYDDSRKYAYSQNCDARFKNRVMLAPKQGSAIALPTGTVSPVGIQDADCAALTGWTKSGTVAIDSGKIKLTVTPGTSYVYQDIPNGGSYAGKVVTFGATCYRSALVPTSLYLQVDDGVDTTETNVTATTPTAYTVEHTMNAAADKLRIKFYLYEDDNANDIYAWMDNVTVTMPIESGAGSNVIPFGTSLVAATASMLSKSTNGTSFTAVYEFGADITDLCVYQNKLWVMLGASAVPFYTSDLSAFTTSTAYGGGASIYTTTAADYTNSDTAVDVASTANFTAGNYAVWDEGEDTEEYVETDAIVDANTFTLVRGQLGSTAYAHASGSTIREITSMSGAIHMANCGDTLAAIADTTTTIRMSDDPTNDKTPYSTPITVPNSTYTITDMVDDPNGNTLIMKQDGPYMAADDVAYPSIPDTLSDVNTTDSYKGYVWKGWWYVPGGVNKLRRQNLSTDTVEDISITQYAQGDKDMDGKVTAITGDGEYLYLAIDNGTYTEIIAGRDENVEGSVSWVWHPIWHVTPDDVVSMCVSAVSGTKKLYALTNTYSDGVQVFALPQSYSDPLIEANYEVTTSGTFVTPWYSTEFVENDKYWDSVWVGGINFQGYTSLRVSYQLEGQGEWDDTNDWTELGYCSASDMFSGVGATLVYPPEQVTKFAVGKTSRKIRFKLDLKAALDGSTTDEYSPVLTRIRVDGRVESSLDGISLRKKNVTCALSLSGGTHINWNSVKGQLADLATLEAATEPIDFEGPDCIPRQVRFAQEGLETRLARRPAEGKDSEFVAMVTLEEV